MANRLTVRVARLRQSVSEPIQTGVAESVCTPRDGEEPLPAALENDGVSSAELGRPARDLRIALSDGSEMVEALEYVSACEHCVENATIPFDYIIDAVTDCDPTATRYVMCEPLICPACGGEIREGTRVLPHHAAASQPV